MTDDDSLLEQLPPEKLLDTANGRAISAAIEMMAEVAVVEEYLEYERSNRDRDGIVRDLRDRIDDIYEDNDETPPEKQRPEPAAKPESTPGAVETVGTPETDTGSVSPESPPAELLETLHELGNDRSTNLDGWPSPPPTWDEL